MAEGQPVVGMRVVRGPDWKWDNQDGGEGYVGTVVQIYLSWVNVRWDNGKEANYRAGAEGAYDLLVLDSAPAGIIHKGIMCSVCESKSIFGSRWKCQKCVAGNLCTSCYMAGRHDLGHPFIRFETSSSPGMLIQPRQQSWGKGLQSKGLYSGATVISGEDLQQDEEEEEQGVITQTKIGFSEDGVYQWVEVRWKDGNKKNWILKSYDLTIIEPGYGMVYYRDHLPLCGVSEPKTEFRSVKPGDEAMIFFNAYLMQQMQVGHGRWDSSMESLIGETGTVAGFTSNNDVLIKYPFHDDALEDEVLFQFNPAAVRKKLQMPLPPQRLYQKSVQPEKAKKLKSSNLKTAAENINKFFKLRGNKLMRTPSKKKEEKKMSIMISYSWKHADIPLQLAERLQERDCAVWIDKKDIKGNLYDEIGKAVIGADVVVICVSDAYNDSEHCKREANMAADLKKRIIPIKLESEWKPGGWLASLIPGLIYYDFYEADFEEKFQKFVEDIEQSKQG